MQDQRTRILAINFFPAFVPPSSGGEQRYFRLYEHLSREFDVTLLSATFADAKAEVVEHSTSFREVRVPKPPEADSIHWKLVSDGIGPECSALVVALASAFGESFSQRLAELAATADVVIHESPFTFPYDTGAGKDGKPRIYNSYNVEYQLAEQMLQGDVGRRSSVFIREIESRLVAASAAVFATSPEERDTFVDEFHAPADAVFVVPNGFDPVESDSAPPARRTRSALFLGSAHPPNIEAVQFIVSKLAPALPQVTFQVIGSVCKAFGDPVPANVELLGFVTEDRKTQLLATCGAAINPLASGAGTNLKMLDYMAHGAPIVTTAVGARGLSLVDGEHVLVADLPSFASALSRVLDAPQLQRAMADAANRLAHERYTWKSIAAQAGAAIHDVVRDPAPKEHRILAICDYSVQGARGGGEVRIKSLLSELGRDFDVTLLSFGAVDEIQSCRIAPGVVQISVPKTLEHREEDASTMRGNTVSVADLVSTRHCLDNVALVERFREEVQRASIVVFEQCYMTPLLDHVPDGMPVVYASQNVEAELKADLLASRSDAAQWTQLAAEQEARLLARCNLLTCVSEYDRRVLSRHTSAPAVVVENGVRLPDITRLEADARIGTHRLAPVAVFVGSGHPPNVRAAQFIVDTIAPANPDVQFAIVGSVCDAVTSNALPRNVVPLGFLDCIEKDALFALASVAVNPLFEGGGSSLKVPDFLASGLPLLSSSVGVRGFEGLTAGEHFLEVEPDALAEALPRVLADRALCERLSSNAVSFIRSRLDWRILGGRLKRSLRRLLPRRTGPVKVLVLTYRFGDPPRGGAESFLLRVLERWSGREELVFDVVAPAVGTIRDDLHFSAVYDSPSEQDATPMVGRNVLLFPVDPPAPDRFARAVDLHALWMRESVELGRRLGTRLGEGLLGGWNYPEPHGGKVARWASGVAQVRIPAGARQVRVTGSAPTAMRLSVLADANPIATWSIEGRFDHSAHLPKDAAVLELHSDRLHHSDLDPRSLAYVLTGVVFETSQGAAVVDIGTGMEDALRRTQPQAWIDALIEVTGERCAELDSSFIPLRGPNSSALVQWLEDHAGEYDVILAQGVPFSTSVLGQQVARRHGIASVVLPHFHVEDRYYHWRAFYEAFQNADTVIAAPTASKPAFFDRIGVQSVALPGGGIDGADFSEDSIEAGLAAFRGVHPSDRPFVLVLGRKAAAKNYATVIEAHQRLVAAGVDLDFVMIGPDDDGLALSGKRIHYYGSQPRSVVLGALASARCLVNMSDSESFGIVLLESWMAGRPVIANRSTAAFAELVEDGRNGFLADGVEDVARGIQRYLLEPELARQHGSAGRQDAMKYEWNVLADGILSSILGVCGGDSDAS